MAASLDFTSVTVCSGGHHIKIGVSLDTNGVVRSRTFDTNPDELLALITEDDLESFLRVILRIIKAQNPANLRNAVLNKVIDLSV